MYGPNAQHPAVARLIAHLESDAPLPIDGPGAARVAGVSLSHLQHLLKKTLGQSYRDLARSARVRRAHRRLLAEPSCTISEIADELGYTMKTMCRHFQKELGVCPSALRRAAR